MSTTMLSPFVYGGSLVSRKYLTLQINSRQHLGPLNIRCRHDATTVMPMHATAREASCADEPASKRADKFWDKWKQLNWSAFKWIFLNSLLGYSLPMAMYYYGLRDTSVSYAAIISSLTPLVTFIISVMFRMEKLDIGTKAGIAKIAGTLVCIGGAVLIILYRGKELSFCASTMGVGCMASTNQTWPWPMGRHQLRGTLLLLGDCISYALWYPIQWKLYKLYPWKCWATTFTCVLGGLQTLVIGLSLTRQPLAWKLGWNLQLLTIIYSAALGMSTKYCLNLFVVSKQGPAYTSMFSSLSVVFTIVLGAFLLGEKLTVGSLSSAFLVITGLYLYLHGKANESSSKC